MALSTLPLAYCANVHPAETFEEAFSALQRHAAPVQERLGHPIGVGAWMTRDAISAVDAAPALANGLADWLADRGLVCYTMNAFPFGAFHARRVKENVYLPDWTSRERRDYTLAVARLLARVLPEGTDGSISTLPLAFKHGTAPAPPRGGVRKETLVADVFAPFVDRLVETAVALAELRASTGKMIRLAIEPEPCCRIETIGEAIHFFAALRDRVAGRSEARAAGEHLGLCLDVCHSAVEFEDVAAAIDRLEAAEIRICKVHVTCALELSNPRDGDARAHLADFVEERYLHQTFGRRPDGAILFQTDLTRELALTPPEEWLGCDQWRTHFHVPVNQERMGPLSTTRRQLAEALARIDRLEYAPHLEVETYTWSVLPRGATGPAVDLVAGLEAELRSAGELIDASRSTA